MYGGILGAILSTLQRTSPKKFSLYESTVSIVAQAISRILVGGVSGFIVVVMAEADVAFNLIEGSLPFTFVAGLVAGFSERLIPDMLGSLAKNKETAA